MNASLTIQQPDIAVRKPARTNVLASIEAFFALHFASLFAAADDPAALRYAAGKYDGETD